MRRSTLAVLALCTALAGCSLPRWPVEGTVTSPFGLRLDGWRVDLHRGIDIAVDEGTPVRAMSRGRVAFAGTMSGYGYVVILDHGGGLRTLYAHLSALGVEAGQEVDGGAVIARSGSSGSATGPHLHFEVLQRGQAADPVPLLGGFPAP